jgi:hypothetical protein
MKLFILTNHTASQQQLDDARLSLGVSEFVDLPVDLKTLWGNVPPDIESVTEYVTPLLCWLDSSLQNEDIVWVQGEWGVTLAVIDWCRNRKVRCVYSTTKRVAIETPSPDGSIALTHVFSHVRFRFF